MSNPECIAFLDTEGAWHPVPHEELIRCMDCKYFLAGKYCLNNDFYPDPIDYCSWAERKDDETN